MSSSFTNTKVEKEALLLEKASNTERISHRAKSICVFLSKKAKNRL
jgi:hypothetical protein